MKVRGFSGGMIVYGRDKPNTYYIELWEQPFHRWAISRLYHWYDMRVEKLPFVSRFEKWHHRRAKGSLFDAGELFYIPLFARRDIRCYHLTKRGRVTLATIDIDYEKYVEIYPGRGKR